MDDSDQEYLDMGVFRHVKNRLPWLAIMMVALMITGVVISTVQDACAGDRTGGVLRSQVQEEMREPRPLP